MRTIRQRLTWGLLGGAFALLALGETGLYLSIRAALRGQYDEALRAKAVAIAALMKFDDGEIDLELPDQFSRGFERRLGTDFFQARDLKGKSLKRSPSLRKLDLPADHGTMREPKIRDLDLPSGNPGRAIGFLYKEEEDDDPEDTFSFVLASDRSGLDRTLSTIAIALSGFGVLLLAAAAVAIPRVLRRGLAPLDDLAERAGGITGETLSLRFPTEGLPGELIPIGSRLNDLMERLEDSFKRLEASFERERRFSADLAHELRTPIAELRGFAELALHLPHERTAQNDREVLAIALQMEGLVTSLLGMVRSERGMIPVTKAPTLVAPLVTGVWSSLAGKAAEKRLVFDMDIDADTTLHTDAVLFRSILSNLLDNAVEYTPPGGSVRVEGGFHSGNRGLRIVNTVGDLGPADVSRLFERFWRKDAARSSQEHCGLGLSLCRAFAQILDLEISASLDRNSGLVLELAERKEDGGA